MSAPPRPSAGCPTRSWTGRSPPTPRGAQAIAAFEAKRAEQKQLGKLIPQAQGDEKQALLAQTKTLAAEVKAAEAAQGAAEAEWQARR